jgi:hypothetical protein
LSVRVRIFPAAVALGVALFCGCEAKVARQKIVDATGTNSLAVMIIRTRPISYVIGGEESYRFDSLAWQTKDPYKWTDYSVIPLKVFRFRNSHLRAVEEIHSFDPTNGTAIIKVVEGNAPPGGFDTGYAFSWREWNLLTNGEVRFIRACTNRLEKF